MVISLRLISSEKTTDVMSCLIEADRAMSMPMVELCVGIIERPGEVQVRRVLDLHAADRHALDRLDGRR